MLKHTIRGCIHTLTRVATYAYYIIDTIQYNTI